MQAGSPGQRPGPHERADEAPRPFPDMRSARMAPVLGACMAAARRPTPDELDVVTGRMWRDMNISRARPRPAPGTPQHARLLRLVRAAIGIPPPPSVHTCPKCGGEHGMGAAQPEACA